MITNDESVGHGFMDMNRFFRSVASKIGAGTTEIILVVAIAANYFGYITINEPYYKYVILWLLAQTLGVPFLANEGTAKKAENGVCPHCGVGYSIMGYKCKTCGYVVPSPNEKSKK